MTKRLDQFPIGTKAVDRHGRVWSVVRVLQGWPDAEARYLLKHGETEAWMGHAQLDKFIKVGLPT